MQTVRDAVRTIEFALNSKSTRDIYVCMGAQRQAIEEVSKKGWKYHKPIRRQENIASLKSLFLDLDFYDYPSPDDAVTSLGNFLAAVDLPRPSIMVGSGGGLHVYWTLARALTPAEWMPLAYALAEATKVHGFKVDTQCTIDSARVLRIPDTFNHKKDNPRPVRIMGTPVEGDYSVERIERALAPYNTSTPKNLTSVYMPPRPAISDPGDLEGGIDVYKPQPVNMASVASQCAFINEAYKTGGKDFTNPLWNLTTLMATFADHGLKQAHLMGYLHPGYTFNSTNDLYERKDRERDEKNLGWPSCSSISGYGFKGCQACQHFNKGKSPLNFAPRPALQPVVPGVLPGQVTLPPPNGVNANDLPKGYVRDVNGIVNKIINLEDGGCELVPVCNFPMTQPWLQKEPGLLNFTTRTDRVQQVSMPTEIIGTMEMRKFLQGRIAMLHEYQIKTASEFFVSWVEQLRTIKHSVVDTEPFGWNVANGNVNGFSFSGTLYQPGGIRQAPTSDPVIMKQYRAVGSIEPWLEAARMITDQERPGLDAILAGAFAAPLVRFTNKQGIAMSLYSQQSGIGKSSAMEIGLAVWGDPVRAMQSLSDTVNASVHKMGKIGALPLFFDELKTETDTKQLVELLFRLTGGKDKARMSSSANLRDVNVWKTMLVSASNESLLDYITNRTKMTTAGLYRVFEYELPPGTKGQIATSKAAKLVGRTHDNYGNIGIEYAKFLGENFATIEKEVEDYHEHIDKSTNAGNDERFWTALITSIRMGAYYANQLGFTHINIPSLEAFLLTVLSGMRGERSSQTVDMSDILNVSHVLAQFMNAARARHTLYTNRIWISPGRPRPGDIKVEREASKLDTIWAQYGLQDKLIRISSHALSEWLTDKGYGRHMFMKALEDEFEMKKVRGRIGSGTNYSNPTEYLLEIDLAGTKAADLIGEV